MELGKFFEAYGEVESVKILTQQDNSPVTGFVNFEDEKSADSALKADGCTLKGQKISVQRARFPK